MIAFRDKGPGIVYFAELEAVVDGRRLVKIGLTRDNLNTRMNSIATVSRWQKVTGFLVNNPEEYEAQIHREYAEARVFGEWFDLDAVNDISSEELERMNEVLTDGDIREIATKMTNAAHWKTDWDGHIVDITSNVTIRKPDQLDLFDA